jgi:hypothetical protein
MPLLMTDRDRDDTYSDLATGERRRRQKKVLPRPLLSLLLVLAAIIVVVVVIVFVARGAIRGGEAADYQKYMAAVADILERSDVVGDALTELLTSPGDTNRTEIQTRLDAFVAESEKLQVEAEAVEVPKDLLEQGIHQFFLLAMSFRQTGMAELKLALMNALEVEDTEVPSEQVAHALRYLTNSDFLYKEVFVPRTAGLLAEKELTGVNVPSTSFVADPNLASSAEVLDILARLKSTGNLQAVHGVALDKVVTMPDNKEITAGGTFNLTSTDELTFVVTVENQGNMDEKNVPVVITLLASGSTEPKKATVEIPQIKAKAKITVEVTGLNPTPYGEVALLHVEVGPVPEEKYSKNNWIEANVIFKL